jgi:Fe2+ or Zn2+ uptake regulation protein
MEKHSASSRDINHFQQCWDLGYRMLLPVVPPSGGTPNAGKQPGVRSSDGVWHGRGYQEFTASLDVIGEWDAWGASVGLSCSGTGLCGIDIDTLSLKYAAEISELAQEMLGWAPMRIGRAPKVLLPYRCPSKLGYAWAKFRDGFERADDRSPGLVECLAGDGKWFVAQGIHPQTQEPYDWPDGMPRFSELTEITVEKRDAFFEELRRRLPAALRVIQGGLGQARSPEELRGDLDAITEAMRAIPNDPASVPYKLWCDMAAALRGAVDFADGLELFEEWSEQAGFSPGSPRYESPRRVFASLDPPFRLGADYIYHRAEKAGWDGRAGRADWASRWDHLIGMEVPPEDVPFESIFGAGADADASERFDLVPIGKVAERALDHEPRPLIKGLLDEQTMSVVYGDSNVGKTFVVMDMAYHIATGRSYAGMPVTQGAVVYVTTEGGRGVDDRLLALLVRYKDEPDVPFYLLSTDIDLHAANGDTGPLIAAVRALGVPVSLIVVDVLAQAMGQGEENAGRDMGAMVKNGNRIIRATGSHLMWIHHTGKDVARGARGHSSLRAGTDTEIEVIEGEITATKQRNLNRSWSVGFRLVPFTAGARRKGMQMIDTCVVELLPKGSKDADMNLTAALKDVLDILGEMGAVSEEHSVLASDIVEWLGGRGEKVNLANARMRLNRLVKLDAVCRTKRGGHTRYYLADHLKQTEQTPVIPESEMFTRMNKVNTSEHFEPGGIFD